MRFRSLALAAVAALVLVGCDAASDTTPIANADAPLGGDSKMGHAVLSDEKALSGDLLESTLLADLPLSTALRAVNDDFTFRSRGAVFVLSNDETENSVIAFARAEDGTLSPFDTYPTGGQGAPPLGASTDPIIIGGFRGKYLYAVNAGSDEISVFRINGDGLEFYGNTPSGGAQPMSLTASDNRLYVLNSGRDSEAGNVTGFEIRPNGRLRALGVTAELPGSFGIGGPPQIGFDPAGQTVTVTDRPSNQIAIYPVNMDGSLGMPEVTASNGPTPFGFDHDASGRLFVSEANGGTPDASFLTSYDQTGTSLSVISGSVDTNETAACWARVIGNYVYTTNTASGTITGFEIGDDGSLSLLDDDGITANTAANPRDLNIALRYLYAQSDGQIDAFRIGEDGSLTSIGTVAVPMTARGVATR
ncbi:MAG: beta-propeller fold lactonase family protein [Bacteroidota bacterium]